MPEEEIQKRGKLLKDKFEKCKTIVGTQQLHSFEPAEDNKVKVKKYNALEILEFIKFIIRFQCCIKYFQQYETTLLFKLVFVRNVTDWVETRVAGRN